MDMKPNRPHIVIEGNIPFAHGLLEPHAKVSYPAPAEITPGLMADADALITRTRTRCDSSLLSASPCSIIASATIGLDHVDIPYCTSRGIEVCNAPGCNAPAVAQYVMASIISIHGLDLQGLTLGIVGVGHVGSIVARWAESTGMKVLLCDPPRSRRENSAIFTDIDIIAAEADIITFHTPLTKSGPDATYHLCDATFLSKLRRRPVIINSARGPIVDTPALIDAIRTERVSHAVIDCWENEPDISPELLHLATIATPHIAGYSRQGKIRATKMAVAAVSRHFGWPEPVMHEEVPDHAPDSVDTRDVADSYSPEVDTIRLKEDPEQFESLRNNYNLRNEVGS